MNQSFIAINLDDFHANQAHAATTAQILFIDAESVEGAQEHLKRFHPWYAWAVIPKTVFDSHIVYKPGSEDIERKEDMDFCERVAELVAPDCSDCNTVNVTLLGTYTEDDAGGVYLNIKCNVCGKVQDSGDGEFWDHHRRDGNDIVLIEEGEEGSL